ncbi:MAG: DUF6318 family protein [Nocardioides sp.]|uniref:DUF6318 family protein n=1 Tax=Nocardioides sp. TaxID=35761 RepID=UPI0039E6AA33
MAAVLLGGCGSSESEQPALPTPTSSGTSASPTSSPTPAPPLMPEAAKAPAKDATEAEAKASAEAFVRYYWDVVDYAQLSGDTDAVRDLSLSRCKGCNGGIEAVDAIYDAGGHIEGGRTAAAHVGAQVGQAGEHVIATVDVSVRATQSKARYPDSTKDHPIQGGVGTYSMVLVAIDDQWSVSELGASSE